MRALALHQFKWIVSASAVAVATGWALWNLGPASEFVGGWSSDSAIPVLMSNLQRFTLFETYYLGQDRLGAFAFLLCALVHRVTGFVWTPERLAFFQTLTIMSSTVAVALLLRPRQMFAVVWALILVLFPWRFFLFNLGLGCPYGWQVTALLFAWVALRRLGHRVAVGGRSAGTFGIATGLCFLASWISSLSAPVLLGVAAAEALAHQGLRAWRARLTSALAVLCGGGLEGLLRGLYQVYAKASFGHSYRTRLTIQLSGAGDAFVEVLHRLDRGGAGVLLAFAMVAALVGLAVAIKLRRAHPSESVHPNLITLLGLIAMALGMLVIPPFVSHFRSNDLEEKYFTLAAYFSALAAVVALERLASQLPGKAPRAVLAAGWASASAATPAAVFAWHPPAQPRPDFAEERRIAQELARRSPGAFLVSGYWNAYSLAALALPDRLRPYPFDGQYQRTPFLRDELARADAVWVTDGGSDGKPLPPIGSAIVVSGVRLEPSGEAPLTLAGRRFIPYRSASPVAQ
ncbi:MAG TPA: hypothetical protein VE782_13195 [Myxococcaceae bacterium]|nr:hypothetical protein [Myxococcaceae bacterium]